MDCRYDEAHHPRSPTWFLYNYLQSISLSYTSFYIYISIIHTTICNNEQRWWVTLPTKINSWSTQIECWRYSILYPIIFIYRYRSIVFWYLFHIPILIHIPLGWWKDCNCWLAESWTLDRTTRERLHYSYRRRVLLYYSYRPERYESILRDRDINIQILYLECCCPNWTLWATM